MAVQHSRRSTVSLLCRDRYVAVIGANGIGLTRCRAGRHEWLGSAGFISDRATMIALATETLERLLTEHVRGRARLSVLLSSHYSRVGLIPWSEQIAAPSELLSYAQVCFDEVYGKSSEPWAFSLSPEAQGLPRVAAALPHDLLQRIRDLSKTLGLRLMSVQPYLMAAYNRFASALSKGDFLFVVAEPGRSTLMLARGGFWAGVRSVGVADSDQALSALIARESELHGVDDELPMPVYLHAPGRQDSGTTIDNVQSLAVPMPLADMHDLLYVMSRTVN